MNNSLCSIEDVIKMIHLGKKLILSGDEKNLSKLPCGDWIAGTIPYFMSQEGGIFDQNRIYVTEVPEYILDINIKTYNEKNINKVYKELKDNSIGIIIIPALSKTHLAFALNAPYYDEFTLKPLIGWISGVCLDDLKSVKPKVYASRNNQVEVFEDEAVIIEMLLPQNKAANIDIVNIFDIGDGDIIEFEETAFSAQYAIVNGKKVDFAKYLRDNNVNIKFPLITDYGGSRINISFQVVEDNNVKFYGPVFEGLKYKHAKSINNYIELFEKNMPSKDTKITFSCNCILNYLYCGLEGKKTGNITGPITFGEIAYQLLNQTLVYLNINDV